MSANLPLESMSEEGLAVELRRVRAVLFSLDRRIESHWDDSPECTTSGCGCVDYPSNASFRRALSAEIRMAERREYEVARRIMRGPS